MRTRRVCWLNVLSGAKGSSGGERFCPDGANADEPHLSDGWSGDAGLRERGRAFYFAVDTREKP